MREIVFRGKRIDNGNWVYGFLADYIAGIKASVNPEYMGVVDETNFNCVDPYTVGQYTGLTDKNGKRIFEGDILLPSKGSLQIHLLVVFLDFSWQMVLPSQKYYRHRLEVKDNGIYEVIGNIHENPELLEVSDNG